MHFPRVRRFCSQAVAALESDAAATPFLSRPSSRGNLRPAEIVAYLDEFIIGQSAAKKAVANALRNRWRRQQLSEELRREILPRNILMVGATGVGKTEIARRIAQLTSAPFVKVEATKYTEVGYHGADVETCVKDLVGVSVKKQRLLLEEEFREVASKQVEEQLLVAVIGNLANPADHETWLKHLRDGLLDDKTVTVDLPVSEASAGGPEGFFFDPKTTGGFKILQGGRSSERRKLTVKEARTRLMQATFDKLINQEMIVQRALQAVEQEGIIFIDEIDKICSRPGTTYGVDASGEGVQRDLLPIIEGCEVNVGKFGSVKTDHILFICAGAFHAVKPADMLPELQGRLPVRVGLQPLTEADFVRILTEPKSNFLAQQMALMLTEGVKVEFPAETVREIAKVTHEINVHVENIGARRLHTVIEKVMEEISFAASDKAGELVVVTPEHVRKALDDMLKKTDLHKFILPKMTAFPPQRGSASQQTKTLTEQGVDCGASFLAMEPPADLMQRLLDAAKTRKKAGQHILRQNRLVLSTKDPQFTCPIPATIPATTSAQNMTSPLQSTAYPDSLFFSGIHHTSIDHTRLAKRTNQILSAASSTCSTNTQPSPPSTAHSSCYFSCSSVL